MFFSSWLRNRISSRGSLGRAPRRAAAPRFRPRLEALEDRWLPSTLTVTNPFDDGSSGTLRATIAAAASGDTIVFDNSLKGQTIALNGSELLIDKNLNIQGLGADQLAISGNHQTRVFEVAAHTALQVSLADLTIRDGYVWSGGVGGGIYNFGTLTLSGCTLSGNYAEGSGGAILNRDVGNLTLSGCTFSGNSSGSGGALSSSGTVTASGCVFSGNSSLRYGGGAIYKPIGTLSLSGCTFSGNSARAGSGGAIYNGGGTYDTLTVSGCTFTGNSASYGLIETATASGGAIYNSSWKATLTASTLSGNSADHDGGAVYNTWGTLTVSGCTLSGNSAKGVLSGSVVTGGSGGGIFNHGNATVISTTLSNNSADVGGGIYNAYVKKSSLTVSGSTISGNTATTKGGGLYNDGAATLDSTTVSSNSAGAQGGGIFNDSNGALTLYSSTTVTGNLAPDGADLFNLGRVFKKKG